MNVVMIIPTGIGCEIGGHAGDATPAARLLGSVCDKLILHPNVVNASDINEMPPNALYVEGSSLDRFLNGQICLEEVRSNRVLVATNAPIQAEAVNAVSAARATLGIDARIIILKTPLRMKGYYKDGIATGDVSGHEELISQLREYGLDKFDALAVSSVVDVDKETKENYLRNGGVNPWGGIEAIASKKIASALNMPVAHAPLDAPVNTTIDIKQSVPEFNEVVDPRISAEMVSVAYLFCVLKGLHRAPRLKNTGLSVNDVDVLVSPLGCWGAPHIACAERNIPIVAVIENWTVFNKSMPKTIFVENYFEAAGLLAAMKIGLNPKSIRRPLIATEVFE